MEAEAEGDLTQVLAEVKEAAGVVVANGEADEQELTGVAAGKADLEAGSEAGLEAGLEAGMEAGLQAGLEAGMAPDIE